eukprot:1061303-Pyramimonas_sp.AAC.1
MIVYSIFSPRENAKTQNNCNIMFDREQRLAANKKDMLYSTRSVAAQGAETQMTSEPTQILSWYQRNEVTL